MPEALPSQLVFLRLENGQQDGQDGPNAHVSGYIADLDDIDKRLRFRGPFPISTETPLHPAAASPLHDNQENEIVWVCGGASPDPKSWSTDVKVLRIGKYFGLSSIEATKKYFLQRYHWPSATLHSGTVLSIHVPSIDIDQVGHTHSAPYRAYDTEISFSNMLHRMDTGDWKSNDAQFAEKPILTLKSAIFQPPTPDLSYVYLLRHRGLLSDVSDLPRIEYTGANVLLVGQMRQKSFVELNTGKNNIWQNFRMTISWKLNTPVLFVTKKRLYVFDNLSDRIEWAEIPLRPDGSIHSTAAPIVQPAITANSLGVGKDTFEDMDYNYMGGRLKFIDLTTRDETGTEGEGRLLITWNPDIKVRRPSGILGRINNDGSISANGWTLANLEFEDEKEFPTKTDNGERTYYTFHGLLVPGDFAPGL